MSGKNINGPISRHVVSGMVSNLAHTHTLTNDGSGFNLANNLLKILHGLNVVARKSAVVLINIALGTALGQDRKKGNR